MILWDLGEGKVIQAHKAHSAPIHALSFSQESSLLASGSLDGTVRLWDVHSSTTDSNDKSFLLNTFYTKCTFVYNLKFSQKNLLYSIGCFQ